MRLLVRLHLAHRSRIGTPAIREFLEVTSLRGRMTGDEWKPKSRKTLQQLIDEACLKFGIGAAQLSSQSRHPEVMAARTWVANEAMRGRVATVSAVARAFNRNESSLRRALSRRNLAV